MNTFKDIKTLPAISDDSWGWGIAQAELEDGAPLILRFNETAKDWFQHPDLPIKLGFAIPLNEPIEGGLPNSIENQQLISIEDILLEKIKASTHGIQAFIITTGFMKEFVFYIPLGVDIEKIHQAVQMEVKSHEVQCSALHDPEWEAFESFLV